MDFFVSSTTIIRHSYRMNKLNPQYPQFQSSHIPNELIVGPEKRLSIGRLLPLHTPMPKTLITSFLTAPMGHNSSVRHILPKLNPRLRDVAVPPLIPQTFPRALNTSVGLPFASTRLGLHAAGAPLIGPLFHSPLFQKIFST